MHDIHARLLRAEEDLLLALSSGSLEDFENEWAQLSCEITLATKEKWLPENTQALASTVSTRIHAIASSFLDLDMKCQELTTSLLEEIDGIISKEPQFNHQSPAPTKPAIPPYIPLAYAWLLDNLHCPYPSTFMRDSLAKKSGSPRKAIDGWFIDVRKRIGWNALRRTRFCGKKDEIIRAATSFFCENKSDDKSGLDFATIEAAARDLYAEKLRPSALVSHFAEAVERGPLKKNDSASINSRQFMAYPSPSSSPAPSSSCQTTPSSKRARSFDETELEAPDLTSSCQRPSKRQRVTSSLPSPASSRGISKPRSSSPDQPSSFSERHSHRPNTSQRPIPGSNSNSSHQISKRARNAQDASTVFECNYASSSPEPRSSMIHSGSSNSEVQLSLGDENSSVSDVSQVNHRRCMSEVGPLPSSLKNKSPRLQSASDPAFSGASGSIGWPFDPVIAPLDSAFGSLDGTTECEVATFDFSTWSPESLDQTELTIPFQLSSSGAQMSFPQPSIPSNTFIATPSDDNLGLNNPAPFGDELLGMFDFLHEAPSKSGLATFPTQLPPHETGSFNAGFGSKFDNGISHAAESFSWGVAANVQDFLGPLVQQSAPASEVQLSEDDKSKKLKLLAEVQEFAHRLEAEIAVM